MNCQLNKLIDYHILLPFARRKYSDAVVYLLLPLLEQSHQKSSKKLLLLIAYFLHDHLTVILLIDGILGGAFLDNNPALD